LISPLQTTLISNGRIEFEFTDPSIIFRDTSFQFFVDGALRAFDRTDFASFELTAGPHTLLWNLYQPHGLRAYATLRNIHVIGEAQGIPVLEQCSPGTFSTSSNSLSCTTCPAGHSSNMSSTGCFPCPIDYYNPTRGGVCTPCNPGSSADVEGSTTCESHCVFNVTIGDGEGLLSYSLKELNGQPVGPISSPYGTWYINPCSSTVDVEACQRENDPVDGSICLVESNGNVVNNGKLLFFQPNVDPIIVGEGFYLSFSGGDQCPHETAHRMTTIQLLCDSSTESRPALAPLFNNNTCEANFVWRTLYGCPVCNDNDYKKTYGDCVSGSQSVVLTRQTNCNGPMIIELPTENCSLSFKFPIGVVIASGIAFVALLAVAVFVFIKNRRISYQYNRLQETYHQRGHVELDNIETRVDSGNNNNNKSFSIEEN